MSQEMGEFASDLDDFSYQSTASRLARYLVFTVLCILGAAPSFMWGSMAGFDKSGMVVGVGLCIVIYCLVSETTTYRKLRAKPEGRVALRTTYGARLLLTILFPIGGGIDFLTGTMTVELIKLVFATYKGFSASLFGTLVHGFFLHIELSFVFVCALLIAKRFMPRERRHDRCTQCDYNLTGNVSGICPECGTKVPHRQLYEPLPSEIPV